MLPLNVKNGMKVVIAATSPYYEQLQNIVFKVAKKTNIDQFVIVATKKHDKLHSGPYGHFSRKGYYVNRCWYASSSDLEEVQ